MLNLIKAEFQYNLLAIIIAAIVSSAIVFSFHFLNMGSNSEDANLISVCFLIMIIIAIVNTVSEKRTMMQISLPVSPACIALSRIGFFLVYQTTLSAIFLLSTVLFEAELLSIISDNIVTINIVILIISTFIMLHNSLGFYNRFKYRIYLYGTPILLLALLIIFFQQVEAFLTRYPLTQLHIIIGFLGVWLMLVATYVISLVKSPAYKE